MIQAYKCSKPKAKLEPFTYEPAPLGSHDISLKITHCGLCHSDLHLIDNDWDITEFPLVPGHEIIGTITDKGELIDHLEIGQRAGIGWQGSSCMGCEWCLIGDENLCASAEATCNGHFGGFANAIVADGRFAFAIPKDLDSTHAAPLLCGGATVFSPFIEHSISPSHHVAIVGIGGLGHLALQFANAWGCQVTAISHSPDKEQEAISFGADHFIDPKNLETNSFDFILSSSTHALDWETAIEALRPRGKLCLLGALEQKVEATVTNLVHGRKIICGSNIASRPVLKRMLSFAALHKIAPMIEEFPLSEINTALDKLRAGKMRYRAVLKI